MAKKTGTTITLDEFAKSINKREARAGFLHTMHATRKTPRTPREWDRLYQLFMTRPLNTPWETWIKKGGK